MFSVLVSTMVALGAAQAAAPANPSTDIIVTGRAPIAADLATRTVADVTIVSTGLQLARFHAPVCPTVVGGPAEAGRAIEDRIRAIAVEVGARTAERGCEGNLMLFFSDDGQGLVRDMRNKRPKWFAGLSKTKADLVEKGDGPVRAWAATSVRNQDGKIARDDGDGDGPGSMQVRGASFMRQQTRLDIDASMVVIDRAAAKGRSINEIADYVAMRGLALTKPPEQAGAATILGLFNSSAGGTHELTAFDLGYLTALYSGSGQESAVEERSRIARALSS